MLIKNGDFIEDRFGQAQRNIIMATKGDSAVHKRIFQWFGSYLYWSADDELSEQELRISNETVRHLKGRQWKPERPDSSGSFFDDLTSDQLATARIERTQMRSAGAQIRSPSSSVYESLNESVHVDACIPHSVSPDIRQGGIFGDANKEEEVFPFTIDDYG
jgi:hypothetical protein